MKTFPNFARMRFSSRENTKSMKRLITFLFLSIALSFTSCYDDSAILEKLNNHEMRIAQLEEWCKQMNTNISSLQSLVSALQNNDYITSVIPIEKDGKIVGYTITFSKSSPITIYNGEDGMGNNAPTIGVRVGKDGCYYWTLNGEWLLDDDGNKIPTTGAQGQDGAPGQDAAPGQDGVTPQLKIEEGYWYVSYDNGANWKMLGEATGEAGVPGDSMFQDVEFDKDYLYLTLADGQVLTLPLADNDPGIVSANVSIHSIGTKSVTFKGHMNVDESDLSFSSVSVYYECDSLFHIATAQKVQTIEFDDNKDFEIKLDVIPGTTYSYCIEVETKSSTERSDIEHFTTKMLTTEYSVKDITPTFALIVLLIMDAVREIVALFILKSIVKDFSLKTYVYKVAIPLLLVGIMAIIPAICIHHYMPGSLLRFCIVSAVSIATTCGCIYYVGLDKSEKRMVKQITGKLFSKLSKKTI